MGCTKCGSGFADKAAVCSKCGAAFSLCKNCTGGWKSQNCPKCGTGFANWKGI